MGKKYKKPNVEEKKALIALIATLEKCNDDMSPEDIQTLIYSTGKENGYSENFSHFVSEVRKKYPKLKITISNNKELKETILLTLNNRKAKKIIQWKPRFNFEKTIFLTLNWYDAYLNNKNLLKKITEQQIDEYFNIRKSNKGII